MAGLPRRSGTYILVMQARQGFTAAAGSLGPHTLSAGWYLYVGSALGPGGVAARCGRHLKADKKPHWHVDYLEAGASIREIWYLCGDRRLEHEWADVLAGWSTAPAPWPGFGASDCRCPSHLWYFPRRPDRAAFGRRAGRAGIRYLVVGRRQT